MMEQTKQEELEQYMKEHSMEMVMVPKNLIVLLQHVLSATSHYIDMGNAPYPATQNNLGLLDHYLLERYMTKEDRKKRLDYTSFDAVTEFNHSSGYTYETRLESIDDLINGDKPKKIEVTQEMLQLAERAWADPKVADLIGDQLYGIKSYQFSNLTKHQIDEVYNSIYSKRMRDEFLKAKGDNSTDE